MNAFLILIAVITIYLLIGWRLANFKADGIIFKHVIRHTEPMLDASLIGATYCGWFYFWLFIYFGRFCKWFFPSTGILKKISGFLSKFEKSEIPLDIIAFFAARLINGPFEYWGERYIKRHT